MSHGHRRAETPGWPSPPDPRGKASGVKPFCIIVAMVAAAVIGLLTIGPYLPPADQAPAKMSDAQINECARASLNHLLATHEAAEARRLARAVCEATDQLHAGGTP